MAGLKPGMVLRLSVTELCRRHGFALPEFEYQFREERRWRFDVAWPKAEVAIEQEGGIWIAGRHSRGSGYVKDMEKYNTAIYDGWRLFRFTPQQILNGLWVGYVRRFVAPLEE